jgi:hypothetical protein
VIKRDKNTNYIILKKEGELFLKLPMNNDQTKSMTKVLKAGGMRKTSLFRKNTTLYFYEKLGVEYTLYTFSHMSAFLEVNGKTEESIVLGLATMDIAINRAIINTSMKQILLKYHAKRSYELLQFLV